MNPENTFYSVKRFIGRRMAEVREESKQVPYQVRGMGVAERNWDEGLFYLMRGVAGARLKWGRRASRCHTR